MCVHGLNPMYCCLWCLCQCQCRLACTHSHWCLTHGYSPSRGSHTVLTFTHSLPHSLTPSLTHPPTHPLTHSLRPSPPNCRRPLDTVPALVRGGGSSGQEPLLLRGRVWRQRLAPRVPPLHRSPLQCHVGQHSRTSTAGTRCMCVSTLLDTPNRWPHSTSFVAADLHY